MSLSKFLTIYFACITDSKIKMISEYEKKRKFMHTNTPLFFLSSSPEFVRNCHANYKQTTEVNFIGQIINFIGQIINLSIMFLV